MAFHENLSNGFIQDADADFFLAEPQSFHFSSKRTDDILPPRLCTKVVLKNHNDNRIN